MQIIIKYYHCRLAKQHRCNFSAFGKSNNPVEHSQKVITYIMICNILCIYVGTLLKTMKYQSRYLPTYLPNIIYYKHEILKSYRLLIVAVLKCLLYYIGTLNCSVFSLLL